jgi:uncharacterized protein
MTTQQVVVIHGADAFNSYDEYLTHLRTTPLSLERDLVRRWKANLPLDLGETYEVIAPTMPNKQNAKYTEWEIWFSRHTPFLKDGVVLVGHSMGGIFLAKYLSEQVLPVKVRATFLVAAPYSVTTEPLGDFVLSPPLTAFAKQAGALYLYYSSDDPIVPFSELAKYQQALPEATTRTFTDRGHFRQEHLPELVADLTSLAPHVQ